MIIFNLDGTLADCEHRRHFVEPYTQLGDFDHDFKPDWQGFYEACDKDTPIVPTIQMFIAIERENICPITKTVISPIKIWSGRCESVRGKTEYWINKNVTPFRWNSNKLKMRPIGDNTPDHELKELWMDEAIAEDKSIDFVFDSDPASIAMYRRRGIFVFDCNQTGK